MAKSASVAIINFHGIGSPVRPFEPDEEPYWVTEGLFEAILDTIAKAPLKSDEFRRLPRPVRFHSAKEAA